MTTAGATTERTYLESVQEAHRQAFRDLDDVFVMGEDVRKSLNNTTVGLVEAFGEDRVIDTPISEPGFVGMGIGAALEGKRPIVELQINTLPLLVIEQILNHAQKLRYMSGGTVSVPLTITEPSTGSSGGSAGQHADCTYPLFMQYGVKTVVPSTPSDVKGLFRSAVEEDDPVILFFPVAVHGSRGDVPDEPYRIPLGEADVKRAGDDVTVVAIGGMVPKALAVADRLADEVSTEVIDPRTLVPFDERTVFESVGKTGRVVIAENANRTCGAAAEIAARIANRSVWDLDAPIKRVTRATAPAALNAPEETAIQPDEATIERAVTDVI